MTRTLQPNPNQGSLLDAIASKHVPPEILPEVIAESKPGEYPNLASEHQVRLVAAKAIDLQTTDEPQQEIINDDRLLTLTNTARKMFPNQFACKSDLTPELEDLIKKKNKGADQGYGLVYSEAFKEVMGISYRLFGKLPEDSEYTFVGKSAKYIEFAEKIFKDLNPNANDKDGQKHLREDLENLEMRLDLYVRHVKLDENDKPDMAKFIELRLALLRKLSKSRRAYSNQ